MFKYQEKYIFIMNQDQKTLKELNKWIGTGHTCEYSKTVNDSGTHFYSRTIRCFNKERGYVLYASLECPYRRPNQFCSNWDVREEDKDFIMSPYKKVDLDEVMKYVDGD